MSSVSIPELSEIDSELCPFAEREMVDPHASSSQDTERIYFFVDRAGCVNKPQLAVFPEVTYAQAHTRLSRDPA